MRGGRAGLIARIEVVEIARGVDEMGGMGAVENVVNFYQAT